MGISCMCVRVRQSVYNSSITCWWHLPGPSVDVSVGDSAELWCTAFLPQILATSAYDVIIRYYYLLYYFFSLEAFCGFSLVHLNCQHCALGPLLSKIRLTWMKVLDINWTAKYLMECSIYSLETLDNWIYPGQCRWHMSSSHFPNV